MGWGCDCFNQQKWYQVNKASRFYFLGLQNHCRWWLQPLTCIQISQEADQVFWYSHLFQNFPQFIMTHTVKGFGIVNKAEIDVFLYTYYVSLSILVQEDLCRNPQSTWIHAWYTVDRNTVYLVWLLTTGTCSHPWPWAGWSSLCSRVLTQTC